MPQPRKRGEDLPRGPRIAGVIVGAILTALLLNFYDISPRISEALPHATWFVVVYVIFALGVMALCEWIVRRLRRNT